MRQNSVPSGFNPTVVRELIGDDRDFLEEIIRLFERDSGQIAHGLREATRDLDASRLALHAHTLKGMLSHFGDSAAIELARNIEVLCKGPTLDGAEELVGDILIEIDLIREGLTQL